MTRRVEKFRPVEERGMCAVIMMGIEIDDRDAFELECFSAYPRDRIEYSSLIGISQAKTAAETLDLLLGSNTRGGITGSCMPPSHPACD